MAETNFLKEMGHRIFLRRKSLGLSQEKLAEKVGVSTQMISNLELGKKAIRPENLAKICQTLEISADYVLNLTKRNTKTDSITEQLVNLNETELDLLNSLIDYMNKEH